MQNFITSVDGVGRLSVLQNTFEQTTSDVNFGKRRSSNVLVTFDEAQNESGTGLYQILLLIVCGLVNMSCAISTTAVSLITPAVEIDFNLNSTSKGILNGAPFLGMVFGAYFWGICSDIKGRRSVILGSMGLDTIFAIISCLTQCLAMFFIARVGNGFAIIGATCMIYVYLGEFLTPNKRDSFLLFLELFWALGMIVGPGVAMVIIPRNIDFSSNTYFKFNSWRVYILLTSIPSLISFILIYQYPETPRYLMLKGFMVRSRNVLERIYNVHNRNKNRPYSVVNLTRTISAIEFNTGFVRGMPFLSNLKLRLVVLKNGHKEVFSQYCKNIFVTSVIEFCIMASYIAVLVWIPELFSRYYDYKNHINSHHTKNESLNICLASEWLLKYHRINKKNGENVSSDAYLVALFVATSIIPLVILTGIAIKYYNKKILLFICSGVPILAALLITITKNDTQAEFMCCIFEGFSTLVESIIFCTLVELFPSNVRGVAFSLTVTAGRLGALFGIVIFGILIDTYCLMTFYLLALLLLIAFLAVAFLPRLKISGAH